MIKKINLIIREKFLMTDSKNATIPEKYLDLFEKKAFAHLATVMPDGSPQVTPVWVDYDGEYILVNSARGRQKVKNVQRDAKVAVSILDPDDPYRYLQVRGVVEEVTEDGADELIDKLAKKYLDADSYPYRTPAEVRITFKIRPDKV
jgi:PPOX class probable F420-dependent enzyme